MQSIFLVGLREELVVNETIDWFLSLFLWFFCFLIVQFLTNLYPTMSYFRAEVTKFSGSRTCSLNMLGSFKLSYSQMVKNWYYQEGVILLVCFMIFYFFFIFFISRQMIRMGILCYFIRVKQFGSHKNHLNDKFLELIYQLLALNFILSYFIDKIVSCSFSYYRFITMANTFFWEICGTINCSWEWVYFVLALLVTTFTAVSLIQTFRYHQKLVFQLLPLSMNVFSMFLLTIVHLLTKSFQLHLAAYLVEIYIYFLFCYSFVSLYLKKLYSQHRFINIIMNVGFGMITIVILILIICVFAGVNGLSATCYNEFMPSFYAFFSLELAFYILTIVFGFLVRKQVRKTMSNKAKIKRSFSPELNQEDRYIKQRIRQIWLILLAYTITVILRITCVVLYQVQFSKSIQCIYLSGVAHVLVSNSPLGQFILIFNQITQMVPHILLPFVLYVIPSSTFKKGDQIDLEKDLIDNPQIEESQNDEGSNPYMKSQISSFYGDNN